MNPLTRRYEAYLRAYVKARTGHAFDESDLPKDLPIDELLAIVLAVEDAWGVTRGRRPDPDDSYRSPPEQLERNIDELRQRIRSLIGEI